ncbi:MAG: hypothetical protein H9855_01605 [Candidatus Acinetobacter avistercoris]|uniref:AbiTii domain-containing protein n=1 Tax=Acinetobacter sp. KS-LM10 TaxID=3120518 RepID=UPI001FA077F2|nr:hypothetical protein [Candidatus Acinetobacter avistercoris]
MKAITALQKLVLDPKSNLTDILRNALLISQKLGLYDFKSWCELELKGYEDIDESNIPEYRCIYGSFHVLDVRNGRRQYVGDQAVGQIIRDGAIFFQETLVSDQDFFDFRFPDDKNAFLKKTFNLNSSNYIFYSKVNKIAIKKVLEIIRTKVLEFSIELDKEGILGEDWEFTIEEKKLAINITNFQGILGDVKHSNVQQTNTLTVQKNDFESLERYLKCNGIESDDILDLKTIIDVSPLPQSQSEYSPDLKNWMTKMIGKSIDGTWQVTVGAAGSLLATGLQQYFGILG